MTIDVDGTTYSISPLSLRKLQEVQREAVRSYKRQVIQTYTDSLDLMGATGERLLGKRVEEVSAWDINDLPRKLTYDLRTAATHEAAQKWIETEYGQTELNSAAMAQLLARALDAGDLSVQELEVMIGERVKSIRVPYDNWWVSSTVEGMAAFVWAALEGGISLDAVRRWPMEKLTEVAEIVERLTVPAVGNT
jgi:hypothetical protein